MHAEPLNPLWIIPKRIINRNQSSLCIPKWSRARQHGGMEHWWERARRAMKDKGITQGDLADHFKMTPAGMQKWLSGTREPSLVELLKIADFIGMSRAHLVLGAEPADDIGDLPDFARASLRRIAMGARSGDLGAEWFTRFAHALQALDTPGAAERQRLDYRSAALGLATALDVNQKTGGTFATFLRQVDEIVQQHEQATATSPTTKIRALDS